MTRTVSHVFLTYNEELQIYVTTGRIDSKREIEIESVCNKNPWVEDFSIFLLLIAETLLEVIFMSHFSLHWVTQTHTCQKSCPVYTQIIHPDGPSRPLQHLHFPIVSHSSNLSGVSASLKQADCGMFRSFRRKQYKFALWNVRNTKKTLPEKWHFYNCKESTRAAQHHVRHYRAQLEVLL